MNQDEIYAQIAREIDTGQTDKALWTRLYAECDGDETKTKVQYIKQRAERLAFLDAPATNNHSSCNESVNTGVQDSADAKEIISHAPPESITLPLNVHPWRRYFARFVDFVVAELLLIALAFSGATINFDSKIMGMIALVLLASVIEVLLLATVGTTLGKSIFGIQLRGAGGEKLTFSDALERTARVLSQGNAFLIPVVLIVPQLFAYSRLKKTGSTLWDDHLGSRVSYATWGAGRLVVGSVVIILALGVNSLLVQSTLRNEADQYAKERNAVNSVEPNASGAELNASMAPSVTSKTSNLTGQQGAVDKYANWLIANKGKKGTSDYNRVTAAYLDSLGFYVDSLGRAWYIIPGDHGLHGDGNTSVHLVEGPNGDKYSVLGPKGQSDNLVISETVHLLDRTGDFWYILEGKKSVDNSSSTASYFFKSPEGLEYTVLGPRRATKELAWEKLHAVLKIK